MAREFEYHIITIKYYTYTKMYPSNFNSNIYIGIEKLYLY